MKWHPSQKTRMLSDGRLELTMTAPGILPVKRWIFQFIPHVEIKAPVALRDAVLKDLNAATRKIKVK